MPCICEARHLSENHKTHSQGCEEYNRRLLDRELREKLAWAKQDQPCSGPGYAHKPHGACPGYAYDRT
jgi:hypothetical protein